MTPAPMTEQAGLPTSAQLQPSPAPPTPPAAPGEAAELARKAGVLPAAPSAALPAAAAPAAPRSSQLPSGFFNPMPGGVFAGYRADTGLDIAGSPRPVHAIAAGTLDYSEPGHTLWVGPRDTANTIRIELDQPIPFEGRRVTHVWYAHLSALERIQREGDLPRARVEAGEKLGVSGRANGSPHLHIGMLLDGEVEQRWGTFLLEDDIRKVLGGYRTGARLPAQ
jgi:hypothetical protein